MTTDQIYNITPSKAREHNNSANNSQFMLQYGGTPEDPEFLYPAELIPSKIVGDGSQAKQNKIDKQVTEMRSNNDGLYRPIGGGKPEHPASVHGREYVQPLVDAAVWGIGGTLAATNPLTTEVLLPNAGHVGKVMMNPAAADTMVGAALATGADAYATVQSLQSLDNTVNRWRNGNGSGNDIPSTMLDLASTIPVVKTVKSAIKPIAAHIPSLGNKTIANLDDVYAKIKHPTWKAYYHGSPYEFDIKNFHKGTVADSGLHMSDREAVAKGFAGHNVFDGNKPTVYKFYAPKPSMEFMDLHSNGVPLLSGNTTYISGNALGKGTFDGTPYSQLGYKALRENGGEDVIDFLPSYVTYRHGNVVQPFQLKRDVTIPIEKYHGPDRPKHVDDRLKEIRKQYDLAVENGDDAARIKLNSEISDIMAENGIPVVKYANNNSFEGGGMSYMLFDRSKMYIPPHIPIKTKHVVLAGAAAGAGGYLYGQNADENKD